MSLAPQAFYVQLVEENTAASVRSVRSHVQAHLRSLLHAARVRLQAYWQRYADAMQQALDQASQGEVLCLS